jgi:large exoprotein involved in heme utilization and adhesion
MKNFKLFLTLAFCSVFFHSLISEKAAKAQIIFIDSFHVGQNTFFKDVSKNVNNISQISCQATGSQDQSEFIVTGSGGLPPNPSESLRSSAIATDSTTSQSNQNTTQSQRNIEAQGWIINERGHVVLTANANTAANFLPSASGCSQ